MHLHSIFVFIFILSSFSIPPSAHAISFVSPIQKDNSTLLYSLTLFLKTPLQPTRLHLDLGASFTWVACDSSYNSSTYQHIPCLTPLCDSLGHNLTCSICFNTPSPSCANSTCSLFPENSVTRKTAFSLALTDSLALPTSDGSTQGPPILLPSYIFCCSPTSLLEGLANNVTGLAAFGRSNYSLPAQLSNTFSVPRCFALCLPRSTSGLGVALIGSVGPYYFSPQKIDLSKSLVYTPLVLNPVGSTVVPYAGEPSDEYYINVTAINVNGKPIQINSSLLTVNENGFGGTKLSTAAPYTVLETSIYNAITGAFVNESSTLNLTVTNAKKSFSVCYPAADIIVTRVGPGVPTVDFVMESEDVFWRVFGSNSMVWIAGDGTGDVWCLGFVDGGVNPRTPVVIGGHQMGDNLLQFDIDNTRLGFTSSVLLKGTTCSNFNFASEG
ncbi:probable aspartic proteinase GIP1 [Hibiscus syriacus]|uniref:probable aspartic proteinase GIP1 n=1 Tax=Hibiscus syriacus TaxID=106335 RepID=UPI0019216E71|nr:probable aspartic proteinase GIP1 [Hibiscus syriacus]